ncbi:18102_t:CDS:2 [Cetraspora pellucida]|uniref:18102_t:CDS:1 n=1 Tax=Cetraspora pellucida TaxID=1433469 RepID=A0ACA9K1Y7_9GLOM|nr:18102_t:CDS:2 [Cetraspora pellucida]
MNQKPLYMLIKKEKIRNFSIIAHIDHGKSTLADRLLEKTNLKGSNKSLERVLDSLSLEQEKGITIKLNAVQLYYPPENSEPYVFNLIDTPGHVDFMYEVSRSLAACEGVILLVDATKGIQAQTLAYYEIAKKLNLKILPTINKIDLPHAQLETTKDQLIELLNCQENDICLISAKTGKNIDLLLEKIIADIPHPQSPEPLFGFNSFADSPAMLIIPQDNPTLISQIQNRQPNDLFTTPLIKDLTKLKKATGVPSFPEITFKVIESFRQFGSYEHELEIEPLDLGIEGMPPITKIIFVFADSTIPTLYKPLTKMKLYNSNTLTQSVGKQFTMRVKAWNFTDDNLNCLSFKSD